jgi:hypothetical protein
MGFRIGPDPPANKDGTGITLDKLTCSSNRSTPQSSTRSAAHCAEPQKKRNSLRRLIGLSRGLPSRYGWLWTSFRQTSRP